MKILVLDTTTKLLKAVLASAATTSNPEFFVSYVDANDQSFSEASVDGGLNGTTQVTLVAAPSSGYKRTVKSITVYNKDTVSQTISIILDNSGTQRTLEKFTLAAGASWHSDSSSGTTTTPGGTDTQVQFNDGGSFGGDAGLTYNKTTDTLTATGGFSGPHNGTVGATTASSGVFTTCRANSWFVGSTNLTMYGDTSSSVGVVLSQAGNMTIQNGNLVIGTSGKGIDFSATPGTGTSELLADYEEGTWTPTLTNWTGSSGATLSGRYVKVGKIVYFSGLITPSQTISSTANSSYIQGLPFSVNSSIGSGTNGFTSNYIDNYGLGNIYVNSSQIYSPTFSVTYVVGKTITFSGVYEATS